jgi:hypothetical protein
MSHIKQVIEPLVEHHVDAPASIELRVDSLELFELVMTMMLTTRDGFDETGVMVNAQHEIRVGDMPTVGL